MPYQSGTRLPGETASKLGHLAVIESPWVQSLVKDFESGPQVEGDPSKTVWHSFDPTGVEPLKNIWVVDGSFVAVATEQKPPREVSFVKTALLMLDQAKIDAIDKDFPHPLLLRDVMKDSGVQHATAFPLKNVRTSMGSNYDAVRNIISDSIRIDQDGIFHETQKWLAYRKWEDAPSASSPRFQCPHCYEVIEDGLPHDADQGPCPHCGDEVFLSDMWGFHMEMGEDSAADSIASSYMLIMEHLMLFTAVRIFWNHTDRSLVSNTLFIKDGPLTLRSQYSKMVDNIRDFLEHAKQIQRPVHMVGQEKTGFFADHLNSIARFAKPEERGDLMSYAPLTHSYVHREVYRSPKVKNPYGLKTNWGEKMYVKVDPGSWMVLNVPPGKYNPDPDWPTQSDLIGLDRILATLPSLVSHKHECALYPVELANGIASMSSYPSASILKNFLKANS